MKNVGLALMIAIPVLFVATIWTGDLRWAWTALVCLVTLWFAYLASTR